MNKGCGVFLNISSLPNNYGLGCFDENAYKFVDFLSANGVKYWQVLPFNPVNYDGSPYQSCSQFAGNPNYINLGEFFSAEELSSLKREEDFSNYNFEQLHLAHQKFLRLAYQKFKPSKEYTTFKQKNRYWLKDYATFMVLSNKLKRPVSKFPPLFKTKKSGGVKGFYELEKEQMDFYFFEQYLFFKQWDKLKKYAVKKHLKIIGDIPIYANHNSVDFWANSEQFLTDNKGNLKAVAGVPPDYFSEDGQLWGNPLYNYKTMEKQKFKWWIERIRQTQKWFDYIKLDHFRGLASFWAVPIKAKTAKEGKWCLGPGIKFFDEVKKQTNANLILEDLGIIDDKVVALRKKLGYPNMKVFQFGFDGNANNIHLPHMYDKNCVSYLGTHDNNTFVGFLASLKNEDLIKVKEYLNLPDHSTYEQITQTAIEKLLSSASNVTILTMQDLLFQGEKYRLNTPGTVDGNWKYQLSSIDQLYALPFNLGQIIKKYGR